MRKSPVIAAALLFALFALAHFIRLLNPFPVQVGIYSIPVWASAVAFIFGALMSVWLFRSLRQ